MKKILKMVCTTGVLAGALITSGCGGGGGDGTPSVALVSDMTITKSHVGNFSQGQTDAKYSVTVKNSGTGDSAGVVTVTEAAPAGLTVRNISGAGWTCDLSKCTRSDVLAAGSSYPVITVSVDVALTAATTLVNSVTVSGGGETKTDNNSASDSTIIAVTVKDVSAGNSEPYDASAENVRFELHPNSTFIYNITKFAAGDKLVFDAGTAVGVEDNSNGADGIIDVIGTRNGSAVTVHLTGIAAASDAAVFGVNSFKTVFGADSLAP
jgi:uncharacterized repeat protein (TIGR01451 family)